MNRRPNRLGNESIILIACFVALATSTTQPRLFAEIPFPSTGGPLPTIELSSSNGYAFQTIDVSGSGASGHSTVRIVILVDVDGDSQPDRTRLLTTAPTVGGDTYAISIAVPDDIATGPTSLCVTVNADTAGFECEPFEVIAPPSASIIGTIGLAATDGDTEFLVYDASSGDEAASVLVDTDGGFVVHNLAPGSYELVIAGDVVQPIEIENVDLAPGQTLVIDEPGQYLRGGGLTSSPLCGVMAFGTPQARIARVTSDVRGHLIAGRTGIESKNIGMFITGAAGPPLAVTFTAKMQNGIGVVINGEIVFPQQPSVGGVRFRIVDSSGALVWEDIATNGEPFAVTYPDVSSLAPGRYVIGCSIKRDDPALESLMGSCWNEYAEFEVTPDPTQDALYSSGGVTWLPESSRYAFAGWMPDIAGLLSIEFPSGGLSIPYLGNITSGFNAGGYVSGFINLDGHVTMTGSRAAVQVRLLGRDIYNESFLDFLDASVAGEAGAVFGGPLGPFGELRDPSTFTLQSGPHLLYNFFQRWPVWSGQVVNLWGLLVVRVSVDLALDAYAYLRTTQQPLEPRLGATLTPEAIPSLNVAVSVKLLLGLARGRADVRTEALMSWPVEYDSGSVPNIFLNDACLGLRMILTASVKVLRKRKRLSPQELFCEENGACGGFCSGGSRGASEPVRVPDAYALPSVAVGPAGRVLAVYVEDTNSNGAGMGLGDPDQTVIARFWNPGISAWGLPLIVSDQQFAASDPATAFVGSDGDAWVIYTQNTIDEDVGPLPADLEDVLAAQEIVASFWDDSLQSFSHEFLTTDGVPIGDGSAAIDADTSGATAAWVRDIDGDISTRNDWAIAVRNWIDGLGWDEMELLDASSSLDTLLGGTSDALNAEVAVVRENGNAYLVWTADADADIDTHDDRRVVLAVGTPVPNPTVATQHYYTWAIEAPAALPRGAEQPCANFNNVTDSVELVLTVRGKDADGLTDTGVGTSNVLWHGTRDTIGTWNANQVMDKGEPIRCENPKLAVNPSASATVLMRRFDSDTPGRFRGQLAMMVRDGAVGPWSDPAWITDDLAQHWDQALAIDTNGTTFMLEVNRQDAPPGAPAVPSNGCLPVSELNDVDEPVQFRILSPDADPAINAILTASRLHAEQDAQVTVTATIRNAGMDAATNVRVQFFDGSDAMAPLLDEVLVAGPLTFNETQAVATIVDRRCGPQPIFARLVVDSPGVDRCNLNNEADVLDVGLLSPPLRTSASISSLATDSVEISAAAPDADDVGGYRFLRSTISGGPYENIGESTQPVLTDRQVTRGVTYFYTVAAFDDCGIISSYSEEVSITLPDVVTRQWAAPLSGPWHNPAGWLPGGLPGEGDDLVVTVPGTYSIALGQDVNAGSLTLGSFPGTQTIDLNNQTLSILKPSQVLPGGNLQLAGGELQINQGTIINQGVIESLGPGNQISGALVNDAIGQIQVRATSPAPADVIFTEGVINNGLVLLDSAGFPAPVILDVQDGIFVNGPTGQIISIAGPGPESLIHAALHNEGIVTVDNNLQFDEPLVTHNNLGVINVVGGDLTLSLTGSDATVTNAGQVNIFPGRQVVITGGSIQNGGDFSIASGSSATVAGPFIQHTGTTTCDGTLTSPQIKLNGGVLVGGGQISGSLNNVAGTVSPGASPGSLVVSSEYMQESDGVLDVELAGLAPISEYDVLSVTGNAYLDGSIAVELIAGFNPPVGATFDVLTTTGGAVSGQFTQVEPQVLPNGRSIDAIYLPDRVRLIVVCAAFDRDCDGDVDEDDYATFEDCMAGPSTAPNPITTTIQECLSAYDSNNDGDVDAADFAEFSHSFSP